MEKGKGNERKDGKDREASKEAEPELRHSISVMQGCGVWNQITLN